MEDASNAAGLNFQCIAFLGGKAAVITKVGPQRPNSVAIFVWVQRCKNESDATARNRPKAIIVIISRGGGKRGRSIS